MRLIDADALTNILCGCKRKDCMYNNKGCVEDDDFEIAFTNTLQVIHDAPTVMEWIPVSERLPKEDKHVLATIRHGNFSYVEIVKYYDSEWFNLHDFAFHRNAVIAWMPLPKEYKESEKE